MVQKLHNSLHTFSQQYPVRKVRKGQMVLYQGEVPRTGFIVSQGVIKIFGISSLGEERVVAYATESDLLPVEWIFDKSPVSLYYYSAFTDCELSVIPKDEFNQLTQIDSGLLASLLDKYMTLYVGTTLHIHALENSRAQDKLLRTLQYLVMRFGIKIKADVYKVNLRLTQQDLANMVGLSRETTAIEVVKLRKRKVLTYQNQYYTIDVMNLLKLLGEDEFMEVKL